jgi:hypothetical protein
MASMDTTFDLEEEAEAADKVADYLKKVEAPQALVDEARKQAADLRSKERQLASSSGAATATR